MSSTMRFGTARNEPQYCSTGVRPRRSSARRSGRFSSREIVDCEHRSSHAERYPVTKSTATVRAEPVPAGFRTRATAAPAHR
jgi:hypothetical protein